MSKPTVSEIMDEARAVDPEYGAKINRFEIAIGEDSLGQDGIFLTMVFDDAEARTAWAGRDSFRKALEDRLFQRFPDFFPYVRVSAESVALDPESAPAA